MKFSKREDIEAPIEAVFVAVSDFAAFERLAARRGIEVVRGDRTEAPGKGMRWTAKTRIRGRPRDVAVEVVDYSPQTRLAVGAETGGILGSMTVDLIELSKVRTRMQIGLDLQARTIAARVMLQTMKLGKSALDRRFARGVASFARDIAERHRKAKGSA